MFLLLLLVAMLGVVAWLLHSLELYYLNSFAAGINERAHLLASFLAGLLPQQPESDLDRFIREFGRDAGVDVSVLDPRGLVLATSGDSDLLGQQLTDGQARSALEGGSAQAVTSTATGGRRLTVAVPISTGGAGVQGAVYMSASLDEIYMTLQEARSAAYLAVVVALSVAAGLAFVLSGTITGPIQEVTSRADQMARGDFDQRISIRSNDEIGQLAAMFNVLTSKVKETLDEISSEKGKLEAVLSHMADGIVALDSSRRVTVLNQAASTILETPEMEAMGRTPRELWPDLPLDDAISRTLGGEDDLLLRFRMGGDDDIPGSARFLRAQFAAIRSAGRPERGMVIVLQDVTEEERLESLRREFVANVSHELRTPLTTVKSYVETLLDGASTDEMLRDRFLEVIASETERMARLVSDLLDLSQIDYQSSGWSREVLSLDGLIHETCARFSPQAESQGVAFEVDVLRAPVYANRDRMQQVMLNLLANAVEYTPPGGVVGVDMRVRDGAVVVTVTDTGVGIPADDLGRVFERFYRVEKARTRSLGGGTGLGLSIAREIVEAHGGSIWIDSDVGSGTSVAFSIPLAREDDMS